MTPAFIEIVGSIAASLTTAAFFPQAVLYFIVRPFLSPDPDHHNAQQAPSHIEEAHKSVDSGAAHPPAPASPTPAPLVEAITGIAPTRPVVAITQAVPAPQVTQPAPVRPPRPDITPTAAVEKAVEKMGEERTSITASPTEDVSGEDVALLVQKELVRLACLADDPDGRWGRKSRKALRRFADRAKARNGDEPHAELLQVLRGYPANYCKLCKPKKEGCPVEAAASNPDPQPSATAPALLKPEQEPENAPSYLPPWMRGEKVAKASEETSSDAAASDAPVAETKPASRRRSWTSVARPRYEAPLQHSRGFWPNISGWPDGR